MSSSRSASRDQIIAEIKRIANASGGKPPGRQTFEQQSGFRSADWYGVHWARWGDALADAGLAANQKQGPLDESFLLQKLAEAVRHFGRVPASAELRMYRQSDPTFPAHTTWTNRFKSKDQMVRRLADWLDANPDYADVSSLVQPIEPSEANSPSKASDGFVYLLKSGGFYKIGRSEELERRVKQVQTSLPERVELDHAIRTDDPAGIETYWHRRFADRRVNGEWFKLTTADVSAFKRRRFQ